MSIPEDVTSSFSDYSSLMTVSIFEGAAFTGDFAVYGCFGLESVSIPEDVMSIGYYAFPDCFSLLA